MAESAIAANPEPARILQDSPSGSGEKTFSALVEGHRASLHSHCHRMLGSRQDAEDAVQETLLRAWRGLPGYQGRSTLKTWLHRIATNVCIDAIQQSTKRAPPAPVRVRLSIEPYRDPELAVEDAATAPDAQYELRESVERAFIAAVQHLPPRQCAVLILRDVLGYSAKEAAVALEATVTSINSALRRARAAVDERVPDQGRVAIPRALRDQRIRELIEKYVDAMERADIEAVVGTLSEETSTS